MHPRRQRELRITQGLLSTRRLTKIGKHYSTPFVPGCDKDVLGLDVSVGDVVGVEILHGLEQLTSDECSMTFFQTTFFACIGHEVASCAEFLEDVPGSVSSGK